MDIPKKKKICGNCEYAGRRFKLDEKTHYYCEHPKWDEIYKKDPIAFSKWDAIFEWWQTCDDFKPKNKTKKWKTDLVNT